MTAGNEQYAERMRAHKTPSTSGRARITPVHGDVRRILEAATAAYGITERDLLGPFRYSDHVAARTQVAVALRARGYSFQRIGRILRRHHTTIVHYLRQSVAPGSISAPGLPNPSGIDESGVWAI